MVSSLLSIGVADVVSSYCLKSSDTVMVGDGQIFQAALAGARNEVGWGEVTVRKMRMAVEVYHGAQITPAVCACKCW